MPSPDRELNMNLFRVSMIDVEQAWKDGAHLLGKACEKCEDMDASTLKERVLRGDYDLIGAGDGEQVAGWAAIGLQGRCLYVHAIYAPGATGDALFEQLRAYAKHNGCDSIRGACVPAVARLWARRFGAVPVQTIMKIEV